MRRYPMLNATAAAVAPSDPGPRSVGRRWLATQVARAWTTPASPTENQARRRPDREK